MRNILIVIGMGLLMITKKANAQTTTYRFLNKGIYFDFDKKEEKIKIPFKENRYFFFSLKNDSVALVQEVNREIPGEIKEYQVSPSYDTVYIKRRSTFGSKKLTKVEKIVYRKVYDTD